MKFSPLSIKGITVPVPIVQGGMGVGVSLAPLAGAVAREGGVGVISSACIDRLVSKRLGRRMDIYEAVREEVSLARQLSGGLGAIGINIMVALGRDYVDTVRGAIDAGVDVIISGAGLPLSLPTIQKPGRTALVPIVSSSRALEVICRKWERVGYRPDAVVLEGPLAGGHLGFSLEQVNSDDHKLETLLPPVLEVAHKYGDIPVIVAGGIYSHADIARFIAMGASAVQMGTRFLATVESSATQDYKNAVVAATEEDIHIATLPGSPCGLPFRVLKDSPMYQSAILKRRQPKCDKGYVLTKGQEGRYSICPARDNNEGHFCICNGLLSSGGYNPEKEEALYTVGSTAHRIKRIVTRARPDGRAHRGRGPRVRRAGLYHSLRLI